MTKAEMVRIKQLRGSILAFLNGCFPNTVARDSIYATYYEYEDVDDINSCLEYLKEKGLVEERNIQAPFNDFYHFTHYYKITAKGIDLLERTIKPDPGIYIIDRS